MAEAKASDGSQRDSWVAILRTVKSPLGFLVLVVLVVQSILVGIAAAAPAEDRRLFFISLVVVLLFAILPVVVFPDKFKSPAQKRLETFRDVIPEKYRYDVFLSAPMAALPDDPARHAFRGKLMAVQQALIENCGVRDVCSVYENIVGSPQWESPDVALRKNLTSIRDSRLLVLIYLERVASSCLVEAGIALGLRKPSVFFVSNREDLPFLLRMAGQAFEGDAGDLPRVRVYEAADLDAVVRLIQINKGGIFDGLSGTEASAGHT